MSSPLSDAIPVPPRSALSSLGTRLSSKEPLSRRLLGICLHILIFFVPLFAFPGQRELLELAKQTFFVSCVGIATILGIWMVIQERRVVWPKNWLHLIPALFLIGYVAVATQSLDVGLSFFGGTNQATWSVLTLVSCVLLYKLILLYIQSAGHVYRLLLTLFLSGIALSVYAILSFISGQFFPDLLPPWLGWTPVGSIYSLTFFLVPLGLSAFVLLHQRCQGKTCPFAQNTVVTRACTVIAWLAFVLSFVWCAFVGLRSVWMVVAIVLMAIIALEMGYVRRGRGALIPWAWVGSALAISVLFIFFRLPSPLSVPPEISPNVTASWLIARQTLHEYPATGIGPGLWSQAYLEHRPMEVNAYPFWNIRFDRGYSTVLTALATLGIVGTILLLVLYLVPVMKSAIYVSRKQPQEVWWTFLIVVAGWLGLTGVFFVYNATLSHQMAWWVLLALLAALTASSTKTYEFGHRSRLRLGMMVALILLTGGVLWGIGMMGYRFALEATYAKTVHQFQAGSVSLEQTIRVLERLHARRPKNDVYTRALSEGYEQRALQLMNQQPTQEQFVQVRHDIATAVALMLDAVRARPLLVDNRMQLASLYQRIASFTPGAYEHAMEHFQQAREQDPVNPIIVYEMGRVMLQQAENDRVATQVQDQQKKKQAQQAYDQHLSAAVSLFQEAIRMKRDYYSAHYQLGVAYERQGRIQEAITEVEQALQENKKNVGLAFELALLYYRVGDKPAARNLLEQVVKAEPQNMNAHWYLSVVYEDLKEFDKAIAEVDFLLQGELKDHAAVKRRRAALQSAREAKLAPTVHALPEPVVPLPPSLNE